MTGDSVTIQGKWLRRPFVNRKRPVNRILKNFRDSYLFHVGVSEPLVRPCLSFSPHVDGIGKTLEVYFRQLVLLNRECLMKRIGWFPGVPEDVSNAG